MAVFWAEVLPSIMEIRAKHLQHKMLIETKDHVRWWMSKKKFLQISDLKYSSLKVRPTSFSVSREAFFQLFSPSATNRLETKAEKVIETMLWWWRKQWWRRLRQPFTRWWFAWGCFGSGCHQLDPSKESPVTAPRSLQWWLPVCHVDNRFVMVCGS